MTALSLYVHWPFCVTKCPYCDFNSHVRAQVDEAQWQAALLADLAHEAAITAGHELVSIFFGGGTPSLMPPATAAAIIDAATRHWQAAPDPEVTLEANPSSVEATRFADFSHAGVNRVSLGLQALDNAALRLLGRPHSLAESMAALETAQKAFGRVSVDLIHSRPGQTLRAWLLELDEALSFGTDHLSAYQLTIEPGTRFHALHRAGRLILPSEDEAADMFVATGDRCAAAGLELYEISNHARPGAQSRHHLQYWRYGAYVGIGPGAHGRRNRQATQRFRRPETWLRAVSSAGHGIEIETKVLPTEAATEALMMGLRLAEGICPTNFHRATGVPLASAISSAAYAQLQSRELVAPGSPLTLTPKGRSVADRVIAMLLGA